MHNGLLRFTGEKMSKSVGNVATIQEVIAEWGRETALLFLMTGHWRKPLEFSPEGDDGRADPGGELSQRAYAGSRGRAATGSSLPPSSTTTSTPRPPSLCCTSWAREGALVELRRGLAIFGLGSLGDTVEAPAELVELARARHGRPRCKGLRGIGPPA